MKRQELPWSELMAFGLGRLKLSPSGFWNMTPRELDASLNGWLGHGIATRPPERTTLDALMRLHPDKL